MNKKTRTLCEAAIMIALAQILSYIRLYEFPNGGSIDVAMLPILVFGLEPPENIIRAIEGENIGTYVSM